MLSNQMSLTPSAKDDESFTIEAEPVDDEEGQLEAATLPRPARHDEKPIPLLHKKAAAKFKKAPQAPKRFKSAFIFFSTEKHREIRSQLGDKGISEKTTNVAKLVSEAWRALSSEDRVKWETMAGKDKTRYEVEKIMYTGPWKVPANKRTPKDPTAPKRPMSAFLAFSNIRRASIKQNQPDATNAEISRALAAMWRDAPEEIRQKYIDEEFAKRQEYKAAMVDWRKNFDEEKRVERQNREDLAMRTAEAMEHPDYGNTGENGTFQQATYADRNYYGAIPQSVPSSGAAEPYGALSAHPNYAAYGAYELRGFPFSYVRPHDGQSIAQWQDNKYIEASGIHQQPLTSLMNPAAYSLAGPGSAALDQYGSGLAAYPQPSENGMSDFEFSSEAARSSSQYHSQGQYHFGGYASYPPGWNYPNSY